MTAIVLCILWLLWPVIAFTGGLSYPIFAGLAALVLLPSALHSLRPRIYMGALLAFLVFVGISATWSPQAVRLVDFDFVHMKFAVRSEMIRVGLLVVAIGCLMAAANNLEFEKAALLRDQVRELKRTVDGAAPAKETKPVSYRKNRSRR